MPAIQRISRLCALLLIPACLWAAATAHAGWGDALKGAGEAGSKTMGLPSVPTGIDDAFRELLSMGTDSAVESLSQDGGFSKQAATSLAVPDDYRKLAETVAPDLLGYLNSAAESAVPAIGELFQTTIDTMEFANPTSLLSGKNDAVTAYFEESARPKLTENAAPLIQSALEQTGAGAAMSAAQRLSSMTGGAFDPVTYLTDKTLDSMFLYLGQTEKGVRSGDIETTSKLLQQFF
jgi:hypothetical protein